MSQVIANSRPPPSAMPRTAAIVGRRIGGQAVPRLESSPVAQRSVGLRGQLADVCARRKGPIAGARDHDRAAGRIGVECLEGVGEFVEQLEASAR